MRRLILYVILGIVIAVGSAEAKTIVDYINDGEVTVKQGVAFSVVDNKFNYTATVPVAEFENIVLSAGYAGRAKSTGDKIIGTLGYKIEPSRWINTPAILDNVEVGAYFGGGHIELDDLDSSESDAGLYVTAVNITF